MTSNEPTAPQAGGPHATPPPLPAVDIHRTDPESPRAEQPETKAAKRRRRWYRKKRVWLPAVAVVLGGVAIVASAGGGKHEKRDVRNAVMSSSTATENVTRGYRSKGAAADVRLEGFENDTVLDLSRASVSVTNHSARRSDYLITVAAVPRDGGTDLATGLATVKRLEPDQSTKVQAQFTKRLPSDVRIVVKSVVRTAAAL